ncbi:MAG: amidohydrolase family protein [Nitrospinae bacterium]|nr:amidohydrolase family protein [Nitrospinota bacterium]
MYISPIVDAHLHISENGEWFGGKYNASLPLLLEQMDTGGVSKGVIMGLAQLNQNEYLRRACEEHRGILYAMAGFNPMTRELAAVRDYLSHDAFKGIKLHPRRDNYSPMDPKALAVYEEAEEKGWVITFDVFGHSALLPLEELRPTVFDRLAKRFPKLKIVLAHCCVPWVLEAFFVAKSNPNLYLDCSFIIERFRGSGVMQDLLYTAQHLDRKLIFGSDFPEEQVHRYLSMAKIEFKDLQEEKKSNIFGLNAIQVYGL